MKFTRRKALITSVGAALAGTFGGFVPRAFAAKSAEELIQDFTGGGDVADGRIKLTAPEIAENGNTVPVSVEVESPMTDDDYVESVTIIAQANPNPGVITFHFTPANGVAVASTRIRLAKTQEVLAYAKMSDGSMYKGSSNVKVTVGGCGG